MPVVIGDEIFDAALNAIATNAVSMVVMTSASATLTDAIAIDGDHFEAAKDSSDAGGGRSMVLLSTAATNLNGVACGATGVAHHINLLDSGSTILVQAECSVTINSTADTLNISGFRVVLRDPTT